MTSRIFFPLLCQRTRSDSDMCQRVFTPFYIRLILCTSKIILIIRYGSSIFAILTKHLRQIKMRKSIRIAITDGIHIGSFSLQRVIDTAVAVTLFVGKHTSLRTIFRRSTGIGRFVMTCSIKVFSTGITLLCLTQTPPHSTRSEK